MTRPLLLTSGLALLTALLALSACGGESTDTPAPDAQAAPATATPARMEGGVQVVEIAVGATGFTPQAIELRAGVPARLVFTRTTENTCATEVQSPALGIPATDLPLDRPTAVEFTPGEAGTFGFACGMDMLSGQIVVQS